MDINLGSLEEEALKQGGSIKHSEICLDKKGKVISIKPLKKNLT